MAEQNLKPSSAFPVEFTPLEASSVAEALDAAIRMADEACWFYPEGSFDHAYAKRLKLVRARLHEGITKHRFKEDAKKDALEIVNAARLKQGKRPIPETW